MTMPFVPMTPAERLEGRIRARCLMYWKQHGTDGVTSAGLRVRAAIWDATGREPSLNFFEDVLKEMYEYDRINGNTDCIWVRGIEVHPRDHDYAEAKSQALEVQDGMITFAVRNLIP